eukprot:441968-Prorocentrum_lima.AAC.1
MASCAIGHPSCAAKPSTSALRRRRLMATAVERSWQSSSRTQGASGGLDLHQMAILTEMLATELFWWHSWWKSQQRDQVGDVLTQLTKADVRKYEGATTDSNNAGGLLDIA